MNNIHELLLYNAVGGALLFGLLLWLHTKLVLPILTHNYLYEKRNQWSYFNAHFKK